MFIKNDMLEKLKTEYRIYHNYFQDYKRSKAYQIRMYNVMHFRNYTANIQRENHWLYQFLVNRVKVLDYTKKNIAIFGSGRRKTFSLNHDPIKIYYTLENNHVQGAIWQECEDMLLDEKSLSLALGFDYINHPKYLRIPWWVMTHFSPKATYEDIRKWCEKVNNPTIQNRDKFCSFICRQDYFGDRIFFLNQTNTIANVNCPGDFCHNDDDLKTIFNDDKQEYLRQFKFNLCPENSNDYGYVTEKIFDAHEAGCIPIYWGSDGKPELDILNQDAIVFIGKSYVSKLHFNSNKVENDESVLKLISDLYTYPTLYKEFAMQPRLKGNAPEIIYAYFERLEKKIIEIIKR